MAVYRKEPRKRGPRPAAVAGIGVAAVILIAAAAALLLKGGGEAGTPSSISAPASTPAPTATPAPTSVDLAATGGYPEPGDKLGSISIEGTQVDCDLYYGDSEAEFDKGAGLYTGTGIPGEGRTIISGAHTNTYYRDLESVEEGDEILISTRYGEYRYRVTGMQVATDTDTTAYDLNADHENLVLYTCYPFGATQYTEQRYFVYGELVEGPAIVDGTASSAASGEQ